MDRLLRVRSGQRHIRNDAADAAAICEAASRGHMRFVALKTVDQQSVLALHTAPVVRVFSD